MAFHNYSSFQYHHDNQQLPLSSFGPDLYGYELDAVADEAARYGSHPNSDLCRTQTFEQFSIPVGWDVKHSNNRTSYSLQQDGWLSAYHAQPRPLQQIRRSSPQGTASTISSFDPAEKHESPRSEYASPIPYNMDFYDETLSSSGSPMIYSAGISPQDILPNSDEDTLPDPQEYAVKLEPGKTLDTRYESEEHIASPIYDSSSLDESDSDYQPNSNKKTAGTSQPKQRRSKIMKRPLSKIQKVSPRDRPLLSPTVHSRVSDSTNGDKLKPLTCPLAPYGCSAAFSSRNEWKRHVTSQHLPTSFWRCDQCHESIGPNDFGRKDLFTEHLRRMHNPAGPRRYQKSSNVRSEIDKSILEQAWSRCLVPVRELPTQAACVGCARTFTGERCCEEWLDHISKHMLDTGSISNNTSPNGMSTGIEMPWENDTVLRNWLLEQGLILPTSTAGDAWRLLDPAELSKQRAEAVTRKKG